jgi:2-keto-3-deoxy-L-rhamnonate aldolase RhmA
MELLLNLAWLLLALPAYWLWRASRSVRATKFKSLQCLLALGCMLVILFPVISATDDLHAMRAEMEESPAGKRTVGQASHEKAPAWKRQAPPALASPTRSFIVTTEARPPLLTPHLLVTASPVVKQAGRAPPDSFPG